MLHALGVMRDGRDGEGCALFGSIIMPHVAGKGSAGMSTAILTWTTGPTNPPNLPTAGAGNLRVVPAHSTAMEQNADVLGLLPSFSLRHALYFNVSHTVRPRLLRLAIGKVCPPNRGSGVNMHGRACSIVRTLAGWTDAISRLVP